MKNLFILLFLFATVSQSQIVLGKHGSLGFWWGNYDSPDHERSEWDVLAHYGYESDFRGGQQQEGNLLYGPLLGGTVLFGIGDGVKDEWYTKLDAFFGFSFWGGAYAGIRTPNFIPYAKYKREYSFDALHVAEGPLFGPFSYGLDLIGGGILIPNFGRAEFQYGMHAKALYKLGWDERYAKDLRFLITWEADPKSRIGLQLDLETRNAQDYFRKLALVFIEGF